MRSHRLAVLLLALTIAPPHALAADGTSPATARATSQPALRTFCNPLDLDNGIRRANGTTGRQWRHAADPCVVLFKDRYYLFSTWDRPGYRVSDDLVEWKYVPFADGTPLFKHVYTAAAVTVIGDALYFAESGTAKRPIALYCTRDPDGGRWEKVADLPAYADPCLFVDPRTERVFVYHGLDRPIRAVELDRTTFREVPDSDIQLMPALDPKSPIRDGWEVCTWDNSDSAAPGRANGTARPCREGSWMTAYNDHYYLQYASPGTTVPGYSDGLLVGVTPQGPFEYDLHSPISRKDSGFITSAGHSCLFQDRYGNWWRAVTMLIGVNDRMERRIGLFPAGFDADGVMYTRTDFGETPITLPTGPRDALSDEASAGWFVLSYDKAVTVSSTLEGHDAKLGADEDVRTWWSAKTGDEGEWLQIDLGAAMDVRAVQVNLAEQDYNDRNMASVDLHQFKVLSSDDGSEWHSIVDQSHSGRARPHTYAQLKRPTTARYVKVKNVHTPGGGKFAVSDLRVFGFGGGTGPGRVVNVAPRRDAQDRRKVRITWMPAPRATGYVIRYGIEPGKLYQHHVVHGAAETDVTLYCLNGDPPYHFRVDAINESGVTRGDEVVAAP
jgi:xylan 1,4-beta-xylosidase